MEQLKKTDVLRNNYDGTYTLIGEDGTQKLGMKFRYNAEDVIYFDELPTKGWTFEKEGVSSWKTKPKDGDIVSEAEKSRYPYGSVKEVVYKTGSGSLDEYGNKVIEKVIYNNPRTTHLHFESGALSGGLKRYHDGDGTADVTAPDKSGDKPGVFAKV
jgi:hypothetical protein